MADYQIQLPTLNAKSRLFNGMKGKTDKNVETYNASSIKKAPSAISNVAAKITQNMERLKRGYTNSDSWLASYVSELTELEGNLANFASSSLTAPIEFKGQFEDIFGKVTMPAIKTGGDPNCNEKLGSLGYEHMVLVTIDGEDYWVVDTAIPVLEYAEYVASHGLHQNAGLLPGDCMLLSQYYAVDMLRGTFTSRAIMAATQGAPAPRINKKFLTQDLREAYAKVYSDLTSGLLDVAAATQVNSWKGDRHIITPVGFKANVKSADDLNKDNLLVLDCVDGEKQVLGLARSQGGHEREFFNQGGNGYLIYSPTDEFLGKEVGSWTA